MALPRRNGQYGQPESAPSQAPNPFENRPQAAVPQANNGYSRQQAAYGQPQARPYAQPAPSPFQQQAPQTTQTAYSPYQQAPATPQYGQSSQAQAAPQMQFNPAPAGAPRMDGSMPAPGPSPYGAPGAQQTPFPGGPQGDAAAQAGPNGEPPLWAPWYGISFQQAFKRFFQKYAMFDGRASRSEYWWWILANLIITTALSSLSSLAGDGGAGVVVSLLTIAYGLGTLVPSLAIAWRRAHDSNKSGLWALSYMIASSIGAVLIVFGVGATAMGGISAVAGGSAGLAAGGVSMLLVGLLLVIIAFIVSLVVNLAKSDPAGARFDKPR